MRKVLRKKPGPKSAKQIVSPKRGTLGDTSDDDIPADESLDPQATLITPENAASKSVQPSINVSEFRSPDPENDATDYGLEFTTSRIQNQSPRRCSTLRMAGSLQEEQSADKNTQNSVNDNETPTTSSNSKSLAKSHRKTPQPKPSKSKTIEKTKNISTPAPQTSPEFALTKKKPRKQRNPIQLEKRFWKEVLALQNRTDHIIPMLPFSRLIREIMLDSSTTVTRITKTALEALQTASEMYLTQRLQDAYLLTLHRGRATLQVEDMQLLNYLKIIS